MNFKKFLAEVKQIHANDSATEHSYRPALKDLLSSIDPDVEAMNEPKREKCGAPDFILSRNGIPVGHVEAKNPTLGIHGLNGVNKEQQKRYLAALPNLIYTNCLRWDFFRDGERVASVSIADFSKNMIKPQPGEFSALEKQLRDFIAGFPLSITSPDDLAKRMAGKAILIKDVMRNALKDKDDSQNDLKAQYEAFEKNLIRDIKKDEFADIYTETIAYGMFAARLRDAKSNAFSRQDALNLLPKSNPFLRSLFGYLAGPNLDDRISWIIDDLARVFQACDMGKLMDGFGELTGQDDAFLHFYETFLAAYDPDKRTECGVWYTPDAVVNFIVRAVDEVLKTEFGLADGLADTSKVPLKGKSNTPEDEVHRVQILDPAAGTGKFLAEVIHQIDDWIKDVSPGTRSSYIEQHLIPRLHGFELLMASYAMCHTRIDMILSDEMGYKPSSNPPRLSVFLTDSLEEGMPDSPTLPFAQWLSQEAEGANAIKRDKPIMCVIGNPPYLGEGGLSKGWLGSLMNDYKKEPGGTEKLKERNPKWLNDLYVKFIRMSENLIEKNGEGVLGFITNHGYLDNPTFRGMRWHLLQTFDRIHVIDLHGNANKKEVTPKGKPDKNVFDIQQGVAIIIAVKTGKKGGNELADVWHGELWGERKKKYHSLEKGRIKTLATTHIKHKAPQYAFVPRDHAVGEIYEKGFDLAEFMPANSVGIVTARDDLVTCFTKQGLKERIDRFADPDKTDEQVRAEFFPNKKAGKYQPGDNRDWKLVRSRAALQASDWESDITSMAYRPLDARAVLYRPDMVDWGRFGIMRHYAHKPQIGLLMSKQVRDKGFAHVFVTEFPSKADFLSGTSSTNAMNAPLYLYPDEQDLDQTIRVNFDKKIYNEIKAIVAPPPPLKAPPDEVAVFDYVYGVLHCPAYRRTYNEFLKTGYPRIPWPATPAEFWDVSAKGAQLRELHLMDPGAIGPTPFPFKTLDGEHGDSVVSNPCFEDGRVWINDIQYFDDAPPVSWDFPIGGYKPAQKWLKDRRGRVLAHDDVMHYQRILKVLSETDRIMRTIEMASVTG